MNVGMLWFDNDPKANLEAKIARAAGYYEKKYGLAPDLCFVNPVMLNNGSMRAKTGEIEVRGNRSVLPNHLWIGIHVPPAGQSA
jgi:hypothetical protein